MTNSIELVSEKIDDYIHSLSVRELNELWDKSTPIHIHSMAEDIEISEKIWAIMESTDLDYESVERILFRPQSATLGDIAVYCKKMNINFWEFIEKALV